MMFQNGNRFKAPGLYLAAQGLEIESAFTNWLMQVLMAIVVMKVQFEKPIRESIQPLPESYPGKDQQMAYIKAKTQFCTKFFP